MAPEAYPTNVDFDVTTPEGRRALANWVKAGMPSGPTTPLDKPEIIFVFDDPHPS